MPQIIISKRSLLIGLINMNELFLPKEMYQLHPILAGCEDFKGIARIDIVECDTYYKVLFKDTRYSMERTMKEFENYVIDLSCKMKLWK